MTKKNKKNNQQEEHEVKSAQQIAAERAEKMLNNREEEQQQEEDIQNEQPQQEPDKKSEEEDVQHYIDLLQRLQAEFSNYRKRVEREKVEFRKYANTNLLEELTDVLDAFERGLHEDHATEVPTAYREGIEGVFRKLNDILSRQGLEKINAVGEVFNPEIHEAAMQEPSEEFAPGTISGEIRSGYMLNERVLRAPLVKVAIAPPKDKKEEQ